MICCYHDVLREKDRGRGWWGLGAYFNEIIFSSQLNLRWVHSLFVFTDPTTAAPAWCLCTCFSISFWLSICLIFSFSFGFAQLPYESRSLSYANGFNICKCGFILNGSNIFGWRFCTHKSTSINRMFIANIISQFASSDIKRALVRKVSKFIKYI